MKPRKIKPILSILVLVLTTQVTIAQYVSKLGYFMENATHKHLMNPALVPAKGYISLPVLGALDLDLRSNLGFTNFIFPGITENDSLLTFMHEQVTPEQFLSKLNPENHFRVNQRTSLLSAGFYSGTSFWTMELASRVNANANLPYALFAFMKQGMTSTVGNSYEIIDLTVNTAMLFETSLGYSCSITDAIRVGVKGKALFGGAKIIGGIDQMAIEMQPDYWSVTTHGLVNLYGEGLSFTKDTGGIIDGVNFSGLKGLAGMGYAFDLGASWQPLKYLQVSAGIVDLGAVIWNKNYNSVARSSGSISYSGFDNINQNIDEEQANSAIEEQWNALMDGLMEMAQLKEGVEAHKLKEKLAPTMNIGVEGGVLDNQLTLGLLYSNRFIRNNTSSELTSIVNYKPIPQLNLAASYSVLNGYQNAFGLAMGANVLHMNIFIACDYLPRVTPQFIPLNRATLHFQFGLSINLPTTK